MAQHLHILYNSKEKESVDAINYLVKLGVDEIIKKQDITKELPRPEQLIEVRYKLQLPLDLWTEPPFREGK